MEEKFDVTGMTCAACQANVTRVVSKLDGVSHCDVSLLSNSMKVEFDQDKVNEQVICEAVKQIGYGASVHGEKGEVKKEWQRFAKNGRIVRIEWNRIKEVLNKD